MFAAGEVSCVRSLGFGPTGGRGPRHSPGVAASRLSRGLAPRGAAPVVTVEYVRRDPAVSRFAASQLSPARRAADLSRLRGERFDVLVVGGGGTGAGAAV